MNARIAVVVGRCTVLLPVRCPQLAFDVAGQCHAVACVYFAVLNVEGGPDSTETLTKQYDSAAAAYFESLNSAVALFTGWNGPPVVFDAARGEVEKAFAGSIGPFTVSTMAFITARLILTYNRFEILKTRMHEEQAATNALLRAMKAPNILHMRIVRYMNFRFLHHLDNDKSHAAAISADSPVASSSEFLQLNIHFPVFFELGL